MSGSRLSLTRSQLLAFRRRAGRLDERVPPGPDSLRRAVWAGQQDSVPRAALLSIHARVAGTEPATGENPSLVQLWGPRFVVFVVAARDLAVFSLGTLPDHAKGRRTAEDLAARLHALLGGTRMTTRFASRCQRNRRARPVNVRPRLVTPAVLWPARWHHHRPGLSAR